MLGEMPVFGFRTFELLASLFAAGSAAAGVYIGYLALRSFARHRDPSMRYLAIGLILLTLVTYTFTFIASVLVHLRLLSIPQQDIFWTVAHLTQFAGLLCIAYALHRRP